MNYFKESIKLILEIGLAFYIIIFSYAVLDNFEDNTNFIANLNNNTREVQLYMESENLILHNVAKNKNNTILFLKVDKNEFNSISTGYLYIDNLKLNLKDMKYDEVDNYYFFEIKDITFNKYETIDYSYFVELDKNALLDYEFIIETI